MGGLQLVGKDPVDEAVKAASQPVAPKMAEFGLQLTTGRPAALMVPADMTDAEWLSLINGVLQIGDQMRAARPASRLVVPR